MMLERVLACSLGLLVLSSTKSTAQAKPDLSGTWTVGPTVAPEIPKEGAVLRLVGKLVVHQTRNQLIIDDTSPLGGMKTVYALDGFETMTPARRGTKLVQVPTTAKWVGDTLIVSKYAERATGTHHITVKMSLTPAGKLLVQATDSGTHIATGRAIYSQPKVVVPHTGALH